MMTKSLRNSILLSILFIGLIRLRPIWERYPGGLWSMLFFLTIAVLFFLIVTKIIIDIIRIIKNKKELSLKTFVPILVMTFSIALGIYNPFNIDLDVIYGKVEFRACYEGTMNHATLKLRDSGKFDIQWFGFLASTEYSTGKYFIDEDTLLLNFNTEIPRNLDDTLVIKDEYLFRLKSDSLISTNFYLGYCKGLN